MANQFEFGLYLLNARERQLTRSGQVIHLQPKAFDVLLYLLEHAGSLVGKQEVLDAVWKDTFVTENSLTVCIRQIRLALGDNADSPEFIQTIPTAGYRFIAEVVTPEDGVDAHRRPEEPGTTAGPGSISRWARSGILLIVVVAVAYLAFDRFFAKQTEDERPVATSAPVTAVPDPDRWENSIAVLPFVNISDDPENEYFADGLA